jgi:hypothetical protein
MKTSYNKDHVLFQNNKGEYHLSYEECSELGLSKAIEFAEKEITKKTKSIYKDKTIDFRRAKALGFCEYGIEDFCEKLDLDIRETYKLDTIRGSLTVDLLNGYPEECFKLFGSAVFDRWGNAATFLKETSELYIVLKSKIIPDNELHELACKFAESVLHIFEGTHPIDPRPRKAIEAKRKWLKGEITDTELSDYHSATYSAYRSASSAAYSAYSASRSASSATAEKQKQIDMTIEVLERLWN